MAFGKHIYWLSSQRAGAVCVPNQAPQGPSKKPSQHQSVAQTSGEGSRERQRLWIRNIFYNPQGKAPAQLMQSSLQDSPERPLLVWIVLLDHSKDLSRPFPLSFTLLRVAWACFLQQNNANPIFLYFTAFPLAFTTNTQSKDWQYQGKNLQALRLADALFLTQVIP